MIIATIGYREFVLNNLTEAETLMRIIEGAKQVESQYAPKSGSYYTESIDNDIVKIEITNKAFATRESHEAIQEEARRELKEKSEAEAA